MTAWVKARNVVGDAGWYIHVGNEKNSMLISPMPQAGDGTFDWRQIEALKPFGGIRIEDNVVVNDSGCDNLTRRAFAEL